MRGWMEEGGGSVKKKPKIYILATGGTIAGTAAREDELTVYRAGAMSVEDLLVAVPAAADYADIESERDRCD